MKVNPAGAVILTVIGYTAVHWFPEESEATFWVVLELLIVAVITLIVISIFNGIVEQWMNSKKD